MMDERPGAALVLRPEVGPERRRRRALTPFFLPAIMQSPGLCVLVYTRVVPRQRKDYAL